MAHLSGRLRPVGWARRRIRIILLIRMQLVQADADGCFEVSRASERELQGHHLLHTVRQVNGDYALRQIQERSSILRFTRRGALPASFLAAFFGYVSSGEVFVYKEALGKYYEEKYQLQVAAGGREKVFVTSHRAHEIFGFQEYPLNWAERLLVEAAEGTRLILFPVELALTSFRKIFNLSVIQLRAELLKRCDFFHTQEIEKLKRIALYARRCQGSKGQIIVKEADALTHLIILVSGEAHLIRNANRQLLTPDQAVGLEDLMTEGSRSEFFLSCLTDCEFVLVPRGQVVRLYKLRYRLEDKESVVFKSRRATEYENIEKEKSPRREKQEKQEKEVSGRRPFFSRLPKGSSIKLRPNTSGNPTSQKSDVRFATFYDHQKTTPSKPHRHFRTEASDVQDFPQTQSPVTPEQALAQLTAGNISLGELCLRKFLSRKEKRQNGEILKYLRSNAPELKLNPSKDYALLKPLHVGDSSYVKNLKRKLRKTYVQSGHRSREEKRSEARFSFFFKEDSLP